MFNDETYFSQVLEVGNMDSLTGNSAQLIKFSVSLRLYNLFLFLKCKYISQTLGNYTGQFQSLFPYFHGILNMLLKLLFEGYSLIHIFLHSDTFIKLLPLLKKKKNIVKKI